MAYKSTLASSGGGGAPTGSAGGDLSGTYPNPTVTKINGSTPAAIATSGSASDLSAGTVPAARLPNPTSSTLGGVQSLAAVTSKWINTISTSGVPSATQPAASDITGLAASATTDTTVATNISSGTLPAGRMPALTGDVTTSAGAVATTVAAIQGITVSGVTGTGNAVLSVSPTLTGTTATGNLTVAGTAVITTTSATAFAVGRLGATTPAFSVDASAASSATGWQSVAAAAGSGVTLTVTSSNSAENATISSKGNGSVTVTTQGGAFGANINGGVGSISVLRQNIVISHAAGGSSSTAATIRFSYVNATDTTLTASTEAPEVVYDLSATRQHATGALTLQRDFRIKPTTHAFVGTSTLTDSATLAVDSAPIGGAFATIINAHGIYVPTAVLANTTNGYALNVIAPTGATNNYAAKLGGAVNMTPITAPSNNVEGDFWNDSTQKCQTYYADGVKQYASTTLFSQTATATITNTTSTLTLLSTGVGTLTLPANFWVTGKTLSINMGGVFSTLITPGNVTISATLGATTIATGTITNILASATNNAFMGFLDITCRATGGSGTIICNGNVNYDTGTLARGFLALNNAGATTLVDTTASMAIDVKLAWATASASNVISSTTARVEILN